MKKIALFMILSVLGTNAFANNCVSGLCHKSVRVAKSVINTPVRVTKKVTTTIGGRREHRRNH